MIPITAAKLLALNNVHFADNFGDKVKNSFVNADTISNSAPTLSNYELTIGIGSDIKIGSS